VKLKVEQPIAQNAVFARIAKRIRVSLILNGRFLLTPRDGMNKVEIVENSRIQTLTSKCIRAAVLAGCMGCPLLSAQGAEYPWDLPQAQERAALDVNEAFPEREEIPDIYHRDWIDFNKNGRKDVYEDSQAPIQDRVEDLLSRMDVNEKLHTLRQNHPQGDHL